jgi:hypothetical protein
MNHPTPHDSTATANTTYVPARQHRRHPVSLDHNLPAEVVSPSGPNARAGLGGREL